MYLDKALLFSHAQKITKSQSSENCLDLGVTEGTGMPVFPTVQVVEGFAGIETLTVHIQSSNADKPLTELAESDWQTILSSQVLTLAEVAKPCSLAFGSLPPHAGKYLRMYYEIDGGTGQEGQEASSAGIATQGAITAGLVLDRQS